MSGKMSREKGRRAEVDLCNLLSDELGIELKRNVDQARNGGADCLELPGYCVEIKRREALDRDAWWEQATAQARKHGGEAICFYRQNRKPWRALMTGNGTYRDVGMVDALDIIRDKQARLFGLYPKAKAE